ncbi:MAG: hypothetical protein CMH64_01815 [Nanoarchaeota archaeon]|nr:hypothetical protein [Nanoarchaeota archaeon]|tara:strand:+ start:1064 stop:2257 length:1194 start_codon:yes stop_codon:yes gene_type:complete
MAYTKYIGYGGTATLLLLIGWFVASSHFAVEMEGDKYCAGTYLDPCEWGYNITLTTVGTYYIQNKDSVDIVFLPDVKEAFHCKRDGRMTSAKRANREEYPCGIGWREFDWKTPLTKKYNYINKFYKNKKQEFKIVVFKHNSIDVIKFGGTVTKDDFDPYFYPNIEVEQICQWTVVNESTYGNVTYDYTCLNNSFTYDKSTAYCKEITNNSKTCYTNWFNYTENPNIGRCWDRHWVVNASNGTIPHWEYNFNWTHNFDSVVNKTQTLYWDKTTDVYSHRYDWLNTKKQIIYWNEWEINGSEIVKVCAEWQGVLVNKKYEANWSGDNYNCEYGEFNASKLFYECDRCGDDGNCDGLVQSGESYCTMELTKNKIIESCKSDTPKIQKDKKVKLKLINQTN